MIARMPELSFSVVVVGEVEAEQAVDLLLIEDALGPALGGLNELITVLDHRRPLGGAVLTGSVAFAGGRGGAQLRFERQPPFGGERVLVDLFLTRHELLPSLHTISLNRTALIWLGAIAMFTRLVNSSLSR